MTAPTEARAVGAVDPRALTRARDTAHHAAQLLALAGASLIAPRADDSHTSMLWLAERAALATERIDAARPFRVALRIADLTLLTLDESGREHGALPLAGERRSDALDWLRRQISAAGLDGDRLRSTLHFTIADHPTDRGEPFEAPADGSLEELARWYAAAHSILEQVARTTADASPVRCWPHHFDIATLITLPSESPFRSIGVGMSPGDGSYAEPYFYVGPYPQPTVLPAPLRVGRWHAEGWCGAVLRASEITPVGDAESRSAVVAQFISDAIAALLALREAH